MTKPMDGNRDVVPTMCEDQKGSAIRTQGTGVMYEL